MDEVTDATFEQDVLRAGTPVVVDFWAPSCVPCKAIAPILEQLAAEHAGRIRFVKVDVDSNPVHAARFGVLTLPTVVVLSDGEVRAEIVGARARKHFERALAPFA